MKRDFTLKKACPSEKGGLRSCNPARGLLGRAAWHSLVGRTIVLCSDVKLHVSAGPAFFVTSLIQKKYSFLALLGLVGEDELRPYEFNNDWGYSCMGGPCVRPGTRGRMIICPNYMLIPPFHN
jgi:hypothetical protein